MRCEERVISILDLIDVCEWIVGYFTQPSLSAWLFTLVSAEIHCLAWTPS